MRCCWTVLCFLAAGCGFEPECSFGEIRYRGRPPSFIMPPDSPWFEVKGGECEPFCDDISLKNAPAFLLGDPIIPMAQAQGQPLPRDDRRIMFADKHLFSGNRALVFEFGFKDQAGGQAPVGWGFLHGDPRYEHGHMRGTAQFFMRAGVSDDVNNDGMYDLAPGSADMQSSKGRVAEATAGRIDIDRATDNHIAGRFYVGFRSETDQLQGFVSGCFDLPVAQREGNVLVRKLGD